MLRVEVDLKIDPLPLLAVHTVAGGEEDLRAAEGYVAGVVEVAALAFRPRAAKRARRDAYLMGVGADDGVERARTARRQMRVDVARRGQGQLARQALLAPVVGTPQLAERLVADDG